MKVSSSVVGMTSARPDELRAFYRDVVGLEPGTMGDWGLDIGSGSTIGFSPHSDTKGRTKEPSRVLLSLFIGDVKAERERLEVSGVEFVRKEGVEFWGGIISTFIDPDGNYCQLIQFDPSQVREEG